MHNNDLRQSLQSSFSCGVNFVKAGKQGPLLVYFNAIVPKAQGEGGEVLPSNRLKGMYCWMG